MENAAIENDLGYIHEHNPIFLETAKNFIADIDDVLSVISAENPKPLKDKPDCELLQKVLIACENYSMDDVDTAMTEIEIYNYEKDDGLVEKLRKHVDMMQFKQIVQALTDLGFTS